MELVSQPGIASVDVNIPSQATEMARPVSAVERIKALDVVRGVALLGILLMNIPGFGIDWSLVDPVRRGPHNTADFRTMEVVSVLFEGTMRGLFSMLFGAGMVLFTLNKKDVPGGPTVAELYYRRLLLLVLFGLINAFIFLWPGDILYFYGLAGMILYPFRTKAAKWLLALGILCIAIGILKNHLQYSEMKSVRTNYLAATQAQKEGKTLTEEQQQALTAWPQRENWRPDADRSARNVQKMRSDYFTVFIHLIPNNASSEVWYMYHGVWDSLCMMFIGMALFGLGFFSNKFSTGTYLMWMVVGYAIGIPISYFMFWEGQIGSLNLGRFVDSFTWSPWELYDIRRVFLCLGHVSLLMLVFRSGVMKWLMKGLANVGQMAFSNYLLQSILCTLFFYGYGLGYYSKLSFHQLYYVVAGVWIFNMIFSAIWLRYFRFGPFEWAWRSLTYGKKQPFRIVRKGSEQPS